MTPNSEFQENAQSINPGGVGLIDRPETRILAGIELLPAPRHTHGLGEGGDGLPIARNFWCKSGKHPCTSLVKSRARASGLVDWFDVKQ